MCDDALSSVFLYLVCDFLSTLPKLTFFTIYFNVTRFRGCFDIKFWIAQKSGKICMDGKTNFTMPHQSNWRANGENLVNIWVGSSGHPLGQPPDFLRDSSLIMFKGHRGSCLHANELGLDEGYLRDPPGQVSLHQLTSAGRSLLVCSLKCTAVNHGYL